MAGSAFCFFKNSCCMMSNATSSFCTSLSLFITGVSIVFLTLLTILFLSFFTSSLSFRASTASLYCLLKFLSSEANTKPSDIAFFVEEISLSAETGVETSGVSTATSNASSSVNNALSSPLAMSIALPPIWSENSSTYSCPTAFSTLFIFCDKGSFLVAAALIALSTAIFFAIGSLSIPGINAVKAAVSEDFAIAIFLALPVSPYSLIASARLSSIV